MFQVGVGTRLAAYTDTEYTDGVTPRVGDLEYDSDYKAFFRFLKQTGSTPLAAKMVAVSEGTGKSAYECELSAGTDSLQNFAGVRVPGATDLADNEYGWFQVSGQATFLHSGGAITVVDETIQTSSTVAGKVEGATDSATGAEAAIGVCEAAVSALDGDVKASIRNCVFAP